MTTMFRMHQLVHRVAQMRRYGDEMPADGDDAMETLNNLIAECREITGTPAPPPDCDHCNEPITGTVHRTENPYDSRDVTLRCEPCAEKAWDRQQERLMEDGPGPSLAEQQEAARRLK